MAGSNRAKPHEGAQRSAGVRLATSGEAWGPNRARRPPENVAKPDFALGQGGPGQPARAAGVQVGKKQRWYSQMNVPGAVGGRSRREKQKCHGGFVLLVSYRPLAILSL